MLTRLSLTIYRFASRRNVLLVFLSLLPFVFVFFPWRSRLLSAGLSSPLRLFDAHFPYSPAQVHALASALGEEGRRFYALTEFTLDLVFPVLYATWLSVTLAWVWRHLRPAWAGHTWPVLLPYLGMLGDYAENSCLAVLMLLYPREPSWLVWFSNLASLVKWSAGLAALGLILAGLGMHLVRFFTHRR
jgi:hypothetical protein